MLQDTDRIQGRTSLGGGTSRNGTHRAPSYHHTHRRSSGPSLTGGCVVRPAQAVLWPPPTPFRLPLTSRRVPVIERRASGGATHADHRAGEGLSSSRRHYPNVPSPLRRGVHRGCTFRIFTASMAFALRVGARLSLFPTFRQGISRRGRLRVMLRTARLLPLKGFRHWASPPKVSPR